jgi:hypothetical protein
MSSADLGGRGIVPRVQRDGQSPSSRDRRWLRSGCEADARDHVRIRDGGRGHVPALGPWAMLVAPSVTSSMRNLDSTAAHRSI